MPAEVKRCGRCHREKPASTEFFRSDRSGTLLKTCLICCEKQKEGRKHPGRPRQVRGATGLPKACSKCGEVKLDTPEFFSWHRKSLMAKCKDCVRAHAREYARQLAPLRTLEQKEHIKKRMKAYCVKKRDTLKLKRREKYDPQVAREKNQAYKIRVNTNPKMLEHARRKRREKAARYRNLNRELVNKCAREYQRNNPEKGRIQDAMRRARLLAAPGTWNGQDVRVMFIRQKACCFYCGCKIGGKSAKWHVDHFIPLSRGGSNLPENLVLACAFCNLSKGPKMPWDFMPEKFSPPDQQAAD
ncbi:HNH endonuclease [Deinococcus sp. D7000]|nr:HNH endonuclease [Deinococcus sp. D7000]